ncbi:MAG: amidohydrolase family protein, partial [Chloroflexi bacterium]|nr:amidohydrolase family protein [Chloroflexota bacterium]
MKAITGATLIDGTGNSPVENATVLIDGDRIELVVAAESVQIPPDAEVIDASGMTLLPGLIDCHDHLASFGYDLASRWGLTEPRSLRHMRIASVLKQTLESGYTTVRDAGGLDAGFRQAVDEGLVPGPRLQVSLDVITPTGGIGDHVSPSGYGHPAPHDPTLPSGVANGPEAMRAKVREMARAGADVIKTATTGGASSRPGFGPKDFLMGRDELAAVIVDRVLGEVLEVVSEAGGVESLLQLAVAIVVHLAHRSLLRIVRGRTLARAGGRRRCAIVAARRAGA